MALADVEKAVESVLGPIGFVRHRRAWSRPEAFGTSIVGLDPYKGSYYVDLGAFYPAIRSWRGEPETAGTSIFDTPIVVRLEAPNHRQNWSFSQPEDVALMAATLRRDGLTWLANACDPTWLMAIPHYRDSYRQALRALVTE